jgi:hypothetical protein
LGIVCHATETSFIYPRSNSPFKETCRKALAFTTLLALFSTGKRGEQSVSIWVKNRLNDGFQTMPVTFFASSMKLLFEKAFPVHSDHNKQS